MEAQMRELLQKQQEKEKEKQAKIDAGEAQQDEEMPDAPTSPTPMNGQKEELNDELEDDDEIVVETNTNTTDEPDPLDLFMAGIDNEIQKIAEQPSNSHLVEDKKKRPRHYEEYVAPKEEEDDEDKSSKKYRKKQKLLERDQSKIQWTPFMKDLYVEVPEIARLTEDEVYELREHLDKIRIRGRNCPKPIIKFTQCGLTSSMLKVIEKLGFENPTPIQCQAIPAIMGGRDVIGIAKTGSGKTLAFLLPLLRQIINQPPLETGEGPIGIVLAPTRELAIQIFTEAKRFCKPLGVRVICCYGGAPIAEQIGDLKRGAEIVVATPGRMIDLLCANSGRVTNLLRVTMVVLDEADRMFDMGFEPQIMAVVNNVRPDRQLLMFSATFPAKVERAAKQIMQKPLEIVTGGRNVVCSDVEQNVEVVEPEKKYSRLLVLLDKYHGTGSIIIFVDTQGTVDSLYEKLIRDGYDCLSLHGGMDQQDRTSTIQDYRAKVKSILVATSVAARGLDVKNLNLVINYDCPNHIEDYVHRVGRTGRAGQQGVAYTFIQPDQDELAPSLIKQLEAAEYDIPPSLQKLAEAYWEKKGEGKKVKVELNGFSGSRGFAFNDREVQDKNKFKRLTYGIVENDEDEQTAIVLFDKLEKDRFKSQAKFLEENKQVRMSAREKAAALVQKFISNKPVIDGEGLYAEIEINEYPQMARWKVTNKESTSRIQEMTGCSIVCKGIFVPPGRPVPPGERKLYLQIEGPLKSGVDAAKQEIKEILQESNVLDSVSAIRDQVRYSYF
eukprot:TRINITY_DN1382_c0_g1_i5.p1 TRINITY_DN1382_c0_g1~~TRINITY_DN1382_c0_g1_i5.p1  ORF type:complete len:778 (-),score=267.91 TRINITY_DN1382_c0_g1_i5:39-2372(-)